MGFLELDNIKSTLAVDLARILADRELLDAGINPNSPAGREFLSRVTLFGIMGVQSPRPELNEGTQTDIP